MKTKKTKEKKPRQPIGKTISNNWFLVKNLNKIAPQYIWPYWALAMLNAFANFISEIWVMQYVLNGVQQGMPFEQLIRGVLPILAVAAVTYLIQTFYWTMVFNFSRLDADRGLLLQLYRYVGSMDLACYESPAFFDRYMKGMNAIITNSAQTVSGIADMLYYITNLVLRGGIVLAIEPRLIGFAILPAAVSLIAGRFRNRVQHEYDMKVTETNRHKDYTRRTFFQIEFAKEMRLTGIAGLMLKRFDEATKQLIAFVKKYGMKIGAWNLLTGLSMELIANIGVIAYVSWQVLGVKTLPIGDAFVMISAVSGIAYTLSETMNIINGFHQRGLYVNEYRDFISTPRRISPNPNGVKAPTTCLPLQLKNLSFTYDGQEHPTIKGIDLTVRPGEKIALVGHNGAGKSTLAKLLLRLYDPTEGSVLLGDLDASEYELDSYRDHFGVVFQDFKLFSLSVKENVMMRRCTDQDDQVVVEALKKSGAWERIERLPNGINTLLSHEFCEDGVVLSGGEGQKVAIARVFARDCGTVILDEPSSALDPIAEYNMYQSMLQACEGKTLIFISHRLSSAVLADRVILLEDGRIAEEGTHQQLMEKDGIYAAMFRSQAEQYLEKGDGAGDA